MNWTSRCQKKSVLLWKTRKIHQHQHQLPQQQATHCKIGSRQWSRALRRCPSARPTPICYAWALSMKALSTSVRMCVVCKILIFCCSFIHFWGSVKTMYAVARGPANSDNPPQNSLCAKQENIVINLHLLLFKFAAAIGGGGGELPGAAFVFSQTGIDQCKCAPAHNPFGPTSMIHIAYICANWNKRLDWWNLNWGEHNYILVDDQPFVQLSSFLMVICRARYIWSTC